MGKKYNRIDPREKMSLQADNTFETVIQKFAPQGKLLRTWKLEGGVSAQVTALEIELPDGQRQKMIVRQHGQADLKRNSRIAADEFKLLQLLKSVGLATPVAYYFDQSGEIFPTPYVVIEFIEGAVEFAPADIDELIRQFATQLALIHAVDCSQLDVAFLPEQEKIYTNKLRKRPARLDDALNERQIRDVLEAAWPLQQRNPSGLLHGDYWPGNILWRDGQLAAVIDWEDAAYGDPLADVANSRLELVWAFGIEAMQSFTRHYQAMTTIDFSNLPYWDLCAALRPASKLATWGLNEQTEERMREEHHWFITRAFEQLSV